MLFEYDRMLGMRWAGAQILQHGTFLSVKTLQSHS